MNVRELLADTGAEVRNYQERIISQAFDGFVNKGYRSILVDSPTGSGKTCIALAIAKALQRHTPTRIGWVAMRRNLLTQVALENVDKRFDVDMRVVSMFDKSPLPELDMLIVDEAQHDVTGSMAHMHAAVKPRWVLGLSATPFRVDRVKLCFDKVLKDAGIQRLVHDGYLSKYHHYTIPDWEPDTVVKYYGAEPERWGKSLVYFHRLDQCWRAWQLFNDRGISCDVVHGSSNCEKQLELFGRGDTRVLINCMKLGEGFNAPDLRTVFCRPSVKSVTIQMAGRVLRKHPSCDVKQVVQSTDTRWNFCRTAGAALMYVHRDGEWRSLQPNDRMDEASRRALVALAQSDSPVPLLLMAAAKRRRHRRFGTLNPGNNTPEAREDRDE